MERFTFRTVGGTAVLYLGDSSEWAIISGRNNHEYKISGDAAERLAAYEGTGLEPEEIKGFAEDVAYQFGYYFPIKDILHISTGGLSTLEWAFRILGWNDPHPVPECECEVPGCHEYANCGTQTKDGYKRVCGKHFAELTREEAEAVLKGGEGL